MAFDYLDWIVSQTSDQYTCVREDDSVIFTSEYVTGVVRIHHLEMDVVEMSLTRKSDDEDVFFLHFELKEEDHAKELFNEMVESIVKVNGRKTLKVLLSCTSGLTTSFFAESLNDAAKTLSLDFEFSAVSFAQLYHCALGYDVILLAPQISYEYKRVSETFHDRLVLKIPGKVFASYNAGSVIDMIRYEMMKAQTTKEDIAVAKVMREIRNNACIMTITMLQNLDEAKYGYRLYDKGKIVESGEVIKAKRKFQDIKDILDTQLGQYRKKYAIDIVSVSLPGVLGMDSSDELERIRYEEISDRLEEIYDIPFYVTNNTNTVALGYYAQQNQYDIITYHSQPRGALIAGQGMVYEGHIINGSHRMAGEVEYVFKRLFPGETGEFDLYERYGDDAIKVIKDTVVSYLVTNIAIIDPQVILVRSPSTSDMAELKKELAKYIAQEDIPELIYVRDVSEYSFLGTMLSGLKMLQKRALKK